jgi:hypothetical protein
MSFRQIIDEWPSVSILADEVSNHHNHVTVFQVRKWRTRNSIPPEYWKNLIAAANRRDITLTSETLVEIAANRKAA